MIVTGVVKTFFLLLIAIQFDQSRTKGLTETIDVILDSKSVVDYQPLSDGAMHFRGLAEESQPFEEEKATVGSVTVETTNLRTATTGYDSETNRIVIALTKIPYLSGIKQKFLRDMNDATKREAATRGRDSVEQSLKLTIDALTESLTLQKTKKIEIVTANASLKLAQLKEIIASKEPIVSKEEKTPHDEFTLRNIIIEEAKARYSFAEAKLEEIKEVIKQNEVDMAAKLQSLRSYASVLEGLYDRRTKTPAGTTIDPSLLSQISDAETSFNQAVTLCKTAQDALAELKSKESEYTSAIARNAGHKTLSPETTQSTVAPPPTVASPPAGEGSGSSNGVESQSG